MSANAFPRYGFTSDNVAGASDAVIQAIVECQQGAAAPYGADPISQQLEAQLAELFECELKVFLVSTGSAANALCLASMVPPWGAVLCHPDSHINNDECGAPEFYTGGAKLIGIEGDNGKLDAQKLATRLGQKVADVHTCQPRAVSITQATEGGQIYSLQEIRDIAGLCHQHGAKLHMDGARFANALVALGCSPAQMTWQAGVDALSLGATKNGVLAAEAIVLFDTSLAEEVAYRRKRAGQLNSKMRLLSAQMSAYLSEDLWLDNARHANAMAERLKTGLAAIQGVELIGDSQANILFCRLDPQVISQLLARGFSFYHDRWGEGVIRLVTNFATSADEVDEFICALVDIAAD